MSGDHTCYSVTAYWPASAGFQEVDSLLRGFGFQRRLPPNTTVPWWHRRRLHFDFS